MPERLKYISAGQLICHQSAKLVIWLEEEKKIDAERESQNLFIRKHWLV
jgi:hypothetical protein